MAIARHDQDWAVKQGGPAQEKVPLQLELWGVGDVAAGKTQAGCPLSDAFRLEQMTTDPHPPTHRWKSQR